MLDREEIHQQGTLDKGRGIVGHIYNQTIQSQVSIDCIYLTSNQTQLQSEHYNLC